MGISRKILLYALDCTSTPFWYGLFNSRIYIPTKLLDIFSGKEFEHMFMHELAHYKRYDLIVSLAATFLLTLHWFNPLIWYAFLRMRAEREAACDELVLKKLGENSSLEYGKTLILMLRSAKKFEFIPSFVALADNRSHLKERINKIARYSILCKFYFWRI